MLSFGVTSVHTAVAEMAPQVTMAFTISSFTVLSASFSTASIIVSDAHVPGTDRTSTIVSCYNFYCHHFQLISMYTSVTIMFYVLHLHTVNLGPYKFQLQCRYRSARMRTRLIRFVF